MACCFPVFFLAWFFGIPLLGRALARSTIEQPLQVAYLVLILVGFIAPAVFSGILLIGFLELDYGRAVLLSAWIWGAFSCITAFYIHYERAKLRQRATQVETRAPTDAADELKPPATQDVESNDQSDRVLSTDDSSHDGLYLGEAGSWRVS